MRIRTCWPWMACAALLGACGDNLGLVPDAGLPAPDAGPPATAFVVAGDYMGTGVASTIALPEIAVTRNVVAGVAGGDPVVRYQDGRIYIINRFGSDNVTVLDADTYELIAQISTGQGSNPQDVAALGDILYVVALNAPGILVLDLARPEAGVVETIDLSLLDENDGIPDCHSIYRIENVLYASCGVLLNFDPVMEGKVAIVDTRFNVLNGALSLETRNPVGFLQPAPAGSSIAGDLLVATAEYSQLTTGCIEHIRTRGSTPRAACLIDNELLGGYASDLAPGAGETLYIAALSSYQGGIPNSVMTSYDMGTGELRAAPLSPASQSIFDLEWCPGDVLLAADARSGGIRVYTSDGSELTTSPLDVGLPPVASGMVCY
jgi:YVTN family beta-propeller protein